ncbi:HEAT-like repeat, putative [Trypanosoma equiperdum]|uniref:HEAT-like repeat, putative n=1 Tax=Trypanosoma equiperdum TaxID=5694 RepID=A0A1G4I247_TRYEQ|nr:HEAT-like repeat, putative [Trypanosoma equiperdum]
MNQEQLNQLVTNLLSADNEVRKSAEAQYDSLVHGNATWMMCCLSELCASTENTSTMQMGLVLLKKLFGNKSDCFDTADAETQNAVKGLMLQVLGKAAFGAQRALAAACVSALVVKLKNIEKEWDELWKSIFQIIEDLESAHQLKTICCEIIAATGPSLTEHFEANVVRVAAGLKNCLLDPSVDSRKAALDAIFNLTMCRPSRELADLVPLILQAVQDALNASNWGDAEALTGKLAEGVSHSATLFERHTAPLLQGLMEVASAPSVAPGARHMAIEALLTYCESEPKTARKVPDFSTSFLRLLFEYTVNPAIPDDWDVKGVNTDEDDLDEDLDETVGSSGIDRLASALGGRKLEALAQQLFSENIQSPDWKQRNAALLLITYVAEGMSSVLEKHLKSIVCMVLPALRDDMKYVRASALDCLTQMSTDFAPQLQENLCHMILPAVVQCLEDPIPAVATRAARCLDSFFDRCEEDEEDSPHFVKEFERYVEGLCASLVSLLRQTPHQFLREDCLGALSSIISTCKDMLKPYVNNLVPVFQEVLAVPDSPDVIQMKCKAIECTTLLACGVGREGFGPYAEHMCNYLRDLLQHLSQEECKDDMRLRYVMRGWTCMTDCLREDVVPYLQVVLPVLLSMVNMECDMEVENAEVGEEDDEDEQGRKSGGEVATMRVVVPGVGVKKIKLHTGLIEEKDLAASVLSAMLTYLGKHLGPHLPAIAESAVKLLSFQSNSSIRESGAAILDEVLNAYEVDERAHLAVAIMDPLLNQFADEDELDASSAMSVVISRCIDSAPGLVSQDTVTVIGEKVLAVLERAMENRVQSLESQVGENDEDELDRLQGEEEEADTLISDTCNVLDKMLERAGDVFAPVFLVMFAPVLEKLLQKNEKDSVVTCGLALLCGLVEHAPNHIGSFIPTIVESCLDFAQSREDCDLLQSAFYLMNLLLQYFGRNPDPSTPEFVHRVSSLFTRFIAVQRTGDYESTTCNAVSAAATLLHLFHSTLPEQGLVEVLTLVVSNLPVRGDDVEARRVHEKVLMWVVQQHPVIQGRGRHAGEIVARMKAADQDVLNEVTKNQLAAM